MKGPRQTPYLPGPWFFSLKNRERNIPVLTSHPVYLTPDGEWLGHVAILFSFCRSPQRLRPLPSCLSKWRHHCAFPQAVNESASDLAAPPAFRFGVLFRILATLTGHSVISLLFSFVINSLKTYDGGYLFKRLIAACIFSFGEIGLLVFYIEF